MDARRANDLLRHITQDKDYGLTMVQKLPLADCIYLVNVILPKCVKEAEDKNNENDTGFFNEMINRYYPIAVQKIKNAERLWIAYSDLTGYPYMLDRDLIILYNYSENQDIQQKLNMAGYKVVFGGLDQDTFKMEVGHMYRNGYKRIRFMDGKSEPFVVDREDIYSYENFYSDDYMTNPACSAAMIDYFQELRKQAPVKERISMIKQREDLMFQSMLECEFMMPCIKTENEEEIEIQLPFIDVTQKVAQKQEGEKVIALPAFTDGYELNKCYKEQEEHMIYRFNDLVQLVNELNMSGIIIDCLGISFFMQKDMMERINR